MRAASAVISHMRAEPFAAVGTAIYVVILVMAVFAPQLAPYDPRRDPTARASHCALSAGIGGDIGLVLKSSG